MIKLSRGISVAYLILALIVIGLTAIFGTLPLPWSKPPFPLPIGPSCEPVQITIAYSSEKQAWLTEAKQRFLATQPQVQHCPLTDIQLQSFGSVDIVEKTAKGEIKPNVIAPSSSIALQLLQDQWKNTPNAIDSDPVSLVSTPLVVVGWQQRAEMLWKGNPQNLWKSLHDILVDPNGWAIHGKPEWGLAKFGHTSPKTSGSGLQTLILLAYAYHNKSSRLSLLDIQNPGFQQWFQEIEQATRGFHVDTATFMDEMVNFGPGQYDVIVVYENLALEKIDAATQRWNQPLRIYYPPVTLFNDHPYALLNQQSTTNQQRQAATMFRDFLLSEEIQALALRYGFRPSNSHVSLTSNIPNNPFLKYQDAGFQIDIPSTKGDTPATEVIQALAQLWDKGRSRR